MDRADLLTQQDEKRMREQPDLETELMLRRALLSLADPTDNIQIENQVRAVAQEIMKNEKDIVLLEVIIERYVHERLGVVLPKVLARKEEFYYQFV